MKIHPLASSSKGNAYAIEAEGTVVLIDNGLAYRTLKARLAAVGLAPEAISAILITHSHTDHTSGLVTFHKHHPEIGFYVNQLTAETLIADLSLEEEAFVCFENGQEFPLGPFTVKAFSIPHDTADPVGFLLRCGPSGHCETYFHGTDIGAPLDSIGLKLREADLATLEANHDPQLLRESGRPPMLIKRIAGRSGHLSNADTAELLSRFVSPRLKQLYLAHLSADCNTPELALSVVREALVQMGREDVEVKVCAP